MTHPGQSNDDWRKWLLLAAMVIIADQATKFLIVASFSRGEELPITGFMSLVLAYNSGAAFSFLAGAPGWQRWFFAIIAVIASAFLILMLKRGGNRMQSAGFA